MFLQERIDTFCLNGAQKRVTLIIVLLFVGFVIFFNKSNPIHKEWGNSQRLLAQA
jgi:hypothetical protein